MGNQYEDDLYDDDYDTDESSGSSLRAQLERALKENKKLKASNDKFRKAESERQAKEVLTDQGFKNPKRVAKDLIADGVDLTDSEAVSEWLQENGDDYAKVQTQQSETADDDTDDTTDEPVVDEQTASDYARLNQTQRMATPAQRTKLEQALAQLSDDASPEEVQRVFREAAL